MWVVLHKGNLGNKTLHNIDTVQAYVGFQQEMLIPHAPGCIMHSTFLFYLSSGFNHKEYDLACVWLKESLILCRKIAQTKDWLNFLAITIFRTMRWLFSSAKVEKNKISTFCRTLLIWTFFKIKYWPIFCVFKANLPGYFSPFYEKLSLVRLFLSMSGIWLLHPEYCS